MDALKTTDLFWDGKISGAGGGLLDFGGVITYTTYSQMLSG